MRNAQEAYAHQQQAAQMAIHGDMPRTQPNDVILRELTELRARVEDLAARPVPSVDAGRWAIMLQAFQALGYALSARALLLLALVGAFVLAMRAPDTMHLLTLGIYALFTVVPVVVLEVRKHRPEIRE